MAPQPPPASPLLTRAEALASHLAKIVAILSLQPEDSPAHLVEAYSKGLRIPVSRPSYSPRVYLYVLPWSRGWSVFVSSDPAPGAYSWRDTPAAFVPLQRVLYGRRNTVGPEQVPAKAVAGAVIDILNKCASLPNRSLHFTTR